MDRRETRREKSEQALNVGKNGRTVYSILDTQDNANEHCSKEESAKKVNSVLQSKKKPLRSPLSQLTIRKKMFAGKVERSKAAKIRVSSKKANFLQLGLFSDNLPKSPATFWMQRNRTAEGRKNSRFFSDTRCFSRSFLPSLTFPPLSRVKREGDDFAGVEDRRGQKRRRDDIAGKTGDKVSHSPPHGLVRLPSVQPLSEIKRPRRKQAALTNRAVLLLAMSRRVR